MVFVIGLDLRKYGKEYVRGVIDRFFSETCSFLTAMERYPIQIAPIKQDRFNFSCSVVVFNDNGKVIKAADEDMISIYHNYLKHMILFTNTDTEWFKKELKDIFGDNITS